MKKIFFISFSFFILFFLSACGKAPAPAVKTPPIAQITAAVVAEHNTPGDCWLIINNVVYAVTDYIANHPGGETHITDYCGKDATTAFETKGGSGKTHSDAARQILAQYYISALVH
jgi:cytochrome b involved in lipid metabolism